MEYDDKMSNKSKIVYRNRAKKGGSGESRLIAFAACALTVSNAETAKGSPFTWPPKPKKHHTINLTVYCSNPKLPEKWVEFQTSESTFHSSELRECVGSDQLTHECTSPGIGQISHRRINKISN